MKARIKLALGVAFAAAAVMAASQSVNPETQVKKENSNSPCYSMSEVQLLMKSNHWTEKEAKTILDLVCQFSSRSK